MESIKELIARHNAINKEKREIEDKLIEYFKPIVIEARDNKDVDKLLEIAETLPFMGYRALIYKAIYEIDNETQS